MGFLQADHFKRLIVPDVVSMAFDTVEEQLSMPHYIDKFLRKNKQLLPPVDPDRMPFKSEDIGGKSKSLING